jgi:hypothetical protein
VASAASIARNLGGRRQGDNWHCSCPLACGYTLSLRDDDDGRLLAYCFGGCEYGDIVASLVEYGLLDDDDVLLQCEGHAANALRREQTAHKIEYARHIYTEAGAGSLVATYLGEARGISLLPPDILKEHLQCPHRLGIRARAMVAPIVDVDGDLTGIHATYLHLDGRRKANFGRPEYQRECRGVARGGAIRLAPYDRERELIVGEGIESTLSAMELFELPGWSAVSAAGMKTVELPSSVRSILIACDNDLSGAGQRNALVAHEKWTAEGRSVRVKCPPVVGHDFNDVLLGRKHE